MREISKSWPGCVLALALGIGLMAGGCSNDAQEAKDTANNAATQANQAATSANAAASASKEAAANNSASNAATVQASKARPMPARTPPRLDGRSPDIDRGGGSGSAGGRKCKRRRGGRKPGGPGCHGSYRNLDQAVIQPHVTASRRHRLGPVCGVTHRGVSQDFSVVSDREHVPRRLIPVPVRTSLLWRCGRVREVVLVL